MVTSDAQLVYETDVRVRERPETLRPQDAEGTGIRRCVGAGRRTSHGPRPRTPPQHAPCRGAGAATRPAATTATVASATAEPPATAAAARPRISLLSVRACLRIQNVM